MSDLYKDVASRSISLVFNNDDIPYHWIAYLTAESDSVIELGACIHDYYIELIANTLALGPEGLGAELIRAMCFNMPSSVFDDLANQFWDTFKEVK